LFPFSLSFHQTPACTLSVVCIRVASTLRHSHAPPRSPPLCPRCRATATSQRLNDSGEPQLFHLVGLIEKSIRSGKHNLYFVFSYFLNYGIVFLPRLRSVSVVESHDLALSIRTFLHSSCGCLSVLAAIVSNQSLVGMVQGALAASQLPHINATLNLCPDAGLHTRPKSVQMIDANESNTCARITYKDRIPVFIHLHVHGVEHNAPQHTTVTAWPETSFIDVSSFARTDPIVVFNDDLVSSERFQPAVVVYALRAASPE